ncbi:MAG: SDR family NAD(P)-dependent oxidoreductase [Rhodospirillales bacterium]|nr:SDR family NAD(P)-dependent oxidoreductase [Rhodospirillales bacterium]
MFATARNVAALSDLIASPLAVEAARLDVTDAYQVDAAIDLAERKFGRIDVLVNCAGYARLGAIEETTDAESRHQFDVNYFGLLNVVRAALPLMRKQGGGHIVNFSSLGGLVATAGAANYCASKFAVEAVSEALAAELAPFGIKVMAGRAGRFQDRIQRRIEDFSRHA